ncbi:hypothetical protein M8J77_002008 [Diaphorina citri]|nr:hypothetical protein M8J77_002008 [Diaphorina citri]
MLLKLSFRAVIQLLQIDILDEDVEIMLTNVEIMFNRGLLTRVHKKNNTRKKEYIQTQCQQRKMNQRAWKTFETESCSAADSSVVDVKLKRRNAVGGAGFGNVEKSLS